MSFLKRVTATGDVATGSRQLHSVTLTPAAAASTVDVRDGSGGAIILSLQAAANGSSVVWLAASPRGEQPGVECSTSIHATIAGASASASFEFN
jgi:hypothetical protein